MSEISKNEIKFIQSLSQKKRRNEHKKYIVEGSKLVDEYLAAQTNVQMVVVRADYLPEFKNKNYSDGVNIVTASVATMRQISQLSTAPEVLAVVDMHEVDEIPNGANWLIALDALSDPGNLGTIVRIADWFGLDGVVCGDGCVDVYNSKTVQATMGSLLRVPIYHMPLDKLLTDNGELVSYAAVMNGTDVRSVKFKDAGIIVIGNESHGISASIQKKCTQRITIPNFGGAESLNAGVAAAVICGQVRL